MLPLEIRKYIGEHADETYELLKTIARIPAPSNHEEKRAEFCCNLLKEWGAHSVYIDEALNVVFPYTDNGTEDLTVFMAHIDVVFPDTDELPLHEEGDFPAIGELIRGAKQYFLQCFTDRDSVPFEGLAPPSAEELKRYAEIMRIYTREVSIRGI